jgi:hypothetical protein
MGTSADFGGPRGGDWTAYKRAASNYARFGEEKQRKKLIHAFARARSGGGGGAGGGGGGGAGGGGGVGAAIVGSGPGIAAFATDVARNGLTDALDKLGLREVIGKDRYEVMGALVDALTGDGATHEDEHARAALVAAMPILFPDDADDFDALDSAPVDEARVTEFLEFWATEVVMSELSLILDKHLQKCETAAEQAQRESDLHADVSSYMKLETGDRESVNIDWRGQEGIDIMANVRDNVEALMLAEGDE